MSEGQLIERLYTVNNNTYERIIRLAAEFNMCVAPADNSFYRGVALVDASLNMCAACKMQ